MGNPEFNKESVDMKKVIAVRKAITEAFQSLKEYSGGLSEGELRSLAGSFSGETAEYFEDFFSKLKRVKSDNK